eukprot:394093_1
MGNKQSKHYQYIFGGEFAAATIAYHVIFWKLFAYFEKAKKKSPIDCLHLSTNTISTIHSVISLLTLYDFFSYKRWEKPTIDEPRLAGHIVAFGCGYFVADTIAHLTCYYVYKPTEISRRWDIIFHHIFGALWWFIGQWPRFIWGWNAYSTTFGVEASTIFLNMQWFGEYFKLKRLNKYSKILFLISWYFIRIPIVCYCVFWLIKYWKQINDDLPLRTVVYWIVACVLMVPLQIVWTIIVSWKLYSALKKKKKKKCATSSLYRYLFSEM